VNLCKKTSKIKIILDRSNIMTASEYIQDHMQFSNNERLNVRTCVNTCSDVG